jgi:hypothetical protein
MILYGLYGFTHGGARVLTVMSSRGAAAVGRALSATQGVIVRRETGRLTVIAEKHAGALDAMVARHAIVVLSREEWNAKKSALGPAIYR